MLQQARIVNDTKLPIGIIFMRGNKHFISTVRKVSTVINDLVQRVVIAVEIKIVGTSNSKSSRCVIHPLFNRKRRYYCDRR
jgi:hypothetical protein